MRFIFCISFCLILFSCSQKSKDKEDLVESTKNRNSQKKLDTTRKKIPDTVDYSLKSKKNTQWDYCDCVSKRDSINLLLSNASESDFENIFSYLDTVDKKCKSFFEYDVQNVHQQKKHKKKVADCMKGKH